MLKSYNELNKMGIEKYGAEVKPQVAIVKVLAETHNYNKELLEKALEEYKNLLKEKSNNNLNYDIVNSVELKIIDYIKIAINKLTPEGIIGNKETAGLSIKENTYTIKEELKNDGFMYVGGNMWTTRKKYSKVKLKELIKKYGLKEHTYSLK